MDIDSSTIMKIYQEAKFWCELGSVIWVVLRVLDWIKSIKQGITDLNAELVEQTASIVNELHEMRADWRAFYGVPPITPPLHARRTNGS